MSAIVVRVLSAAVLALSVSGCNPPPEQTASSSQDLSIAPPQARGNVSGAVPSPAAPAADPAQASVVPPATEAKVNRVESVVLSRPADAPNSVIIKVSGSVMSAGWTQPKLAPVDDANADARIKVFSFVATSPEMPVEGSKPQAVATELKIDDMPAEIRTIRIVSATNTISAPVVR